MAAANERRTALESPADAFPGPRKLVRPQLSTLDRRRDPGHNNDPLTHALTGDGGGTLASSHAEAFYFQKQIQQQTGLTVVLDDGEELHGYIEWHDRDALKLRSGRHRILVYKSAIKYLFKTSDAHPAGTVMK